MLPNAFKWDFFLKVDFLNTVEAKVTILTSYVKPNETMAINKFQRSMPPHPYMVKNLQISYSLEQKANGLGTWYVALGMWSLPDLHK